MNETNTLLDVSFGENILKVFKIAPAVKLIRRDYHQHH